MLLISGMPKEESEGSIFDTSFHKKKETKKEEPSSLSKIPEDFSKDLNAEEMLEKIKTMRKDLEEKIGNAFEQGKIDHKHVKTVLSTLQDDTKTAREKAKKKLENDVFTALGKEKRKEHLEKEQQKDDKVRKGKTLGSRKKWMPMQ